MFAPEAVIHFVNFPEPRGTVNARHGVKNAAAAQYFWSAWSSFSPVVSFNSVVRGLPTAHTKPYLGSEIP